MHFSSSFFLASFFSLTTTTLIYIIIGFWRLTYYYQKRPFYCILFISHGILHMLLVIASWPLVGKISNVTIPDWPEGPIRTLDSEPTQHQKLHHCQHVPVPQVKIVTRARALSTIGIVSLDPTDVAAWGGYRQPISNTHLEPINRSKQWVWSRV